MVRKPAASPFKQLTRSEQESAVPRLEARIRDIGELDASSVQTADDASVQAVQARTKSTLADVFGEGSPQYVRLIPAAKLDHAVYITAGWSPHPPQDIRQGIERGKQRAIALLQGRSPDILALAKALFPDLPAPSESLTETEKHIWGFDAKRHPVCGFVVKQSVASHPIELQAELFCQTTLHNGTGPRVVRP
jgi:hypothetical protein